jgi:transcription antitermination factor NusG
MIVGKSFVAYIHNLSIDECINLLKLKLDIELKKQIKNLIIIKKLIKVISERSQISRYIYIYSILHKVDYYCIRKYNSMQKIRGEEDEELLRQFNNFKHVFRFSRSISSEFDNMLFTIFYTEQAIITLYY